jgi:ribonucleoside-diphosphate reductase beta chain
MKTVLNLENPNNRNNKLFLGEKLGICNFADMKYPIFKKLYDEQLSFFWRPTEINMGKDASDIKSMSNKQRAIFEKNISFQTAGDSFLGIGIEGVIEHVTNNELYQTLTVHSFFEASIHTPSYSHIFENIYSEPSKKFYDILNDKEILHRAKESTEKFNNLLNSTSADPRRHILSAIIGLLALESISFYNSFLTSYYFSKNGLMSGTGTVISLINRDEYLHKSNCINILKILMKEDSEGFVDMRDEIKDAIFVTFKQMADQEFSWIEYLLGDGELPGLTKEGLRTYVKYLTNRSIMELGFKENIFKETQNPFPWVNSYQSSSKSTQIAPQEQTLVNYVKSSKNDIDSMVW